MEPSVFTVLIGWYTETCILHILPPEILQYILGLNRRCLFDRHPEWDWDWYWLSKNPSLPLESIEKYAEKLNWNHISNNPNFTPKLIEKYSENLYWKWFSRNSSLTSELIKKYIRKLDWEYLSANPIIFK